MKQNIVFSIKDLPCLLDHQLENTPFVPMALIVDKLVHKFAHDCCSFTAIEIKAPVMLRKNRIKTLFCIYDGRIASLQDENGNIYATCAKGDNLVSISKFELPFSDTVSPSFLLKHQIYPSLLFHGPTFQADFAFYQFNRQNLLVELSNFIPDNPSLGRYNYKQCIPIVLFDLMLQTAGLHQLAFSNKYGLPTFCGQLQVNQYWPNCNRVFVKTSFFQKNQAYNIVAATPAGESILNCLDLRFTHSNRQIDISTKSLLEDIVNE